MGGPVIRVACPHCGASYDVPADLGGLPIPCRNCGRRFAPPAPPAVAAADEKWRRKRSREGSFGITLMTLKDFVAARWPALAVGGVVLMAALLILIVLLMGSGRRSGPRVARGTEPNAARTWRDGSNVEHDALFEGVIFRRDFVDAYTRTVMDRFFAPEVHATEDDIRIMGRGFLKVVVHFYNDRAIYERAAGSRRRDAAYSRWQSLGETDYHADRKAPETGSLDERLADANSLLFFTELRCTDAGAFRADFEDVDYSGTNGLDYVLGFLGLNTRWPTILQLLPELEEMTFYFKYGGIRRKGIIRRNGLANTSTILARISPASLAMCNADMSLSLALREKYIDGSTADRRRRVLDGWETALSRAAYLEIAPQMICSPLRESDLPAKNNHGDSLGSILESIPMSPFGLPYIAGRPVTVGRSYLIPDKVILMPCHIDDMELGVTPGNWFTGASCVSRTIENPSGVVVTVLEMRPFKKTSGGMLRVRVGGEEGWIADVWFYGDVQEVGQQE